jgi:hypothetical protein
MCFIHAAMVAKLYSKYGNDFKHFWRYFINKVVVIARGFQIAENWKNKSTGTLSLMSMMMIVLGNIGRALSILI